MKGQAKQLINQFRCEYPVWTHNKINRTCKDNPTGHSTRREKERQTEKEIGDNISEWTGLGLGEAPLNAEDTDEWRTVVAPSTLMSQRSIRLRDEWVSEIQYTSATNKLWYKCRIKLIGFQQYVDQMTELKSAEVWTTDRLAMHADQSYHRKIASFQ